MTPTLIPDILKDIEASLKAQAKQLPHKSNWASVMGSPCLRQLVYYRTDWDKLQLPDPGLQGIFNTGTELERIVIRILNEIGEGAKSKWELVSRSVRLKQTILDQYQIGGAPDCFLRIYDEDPKGTILGPVEVKSMAPHIFVKVHTIDDFQRRIWMRKYPAQLTCYMLASEYEMGFFLLFNKANLYDIKFLPMALDQDLEEDVLRKASAVNAHIAAGKLPEKLNDPDECGRCPFNLHCCPEVGTGGNLTILENNELAEILDRLEELEEMSDEIGGLEKERDKILKERQGTDLVVGNWIIKWKKVEGTRQPSAGGPFVQWRKEFIKILKSKEGADLGRSNWHVDAGRP
jgi:hypothetical protein